MSNRDQLLTRSGKIDVALRMIRQIIKAQVQKEIDAQDSRYPTGTWVYNFPEERASIREILEAVEKDAVEIKNACFLWQKENGIPVGETIH